MAAVFAALLPAFEASTLAALGENYLEIVPEEGDDDGKGAKFRASRILCSTRGKEIFEDPEEDAKWEAQQVHPRHMSTPRLPLRHINNGAQAGLGIDK